MYDEFKKKKRGRPVSEGIPKDYKVTIKLSMADKLMLEDMVEKHKLSKSEVLRRAMKYYYLMITRKEF